MNPITANVPQATVAMDRIPRAVAAPFRTPGEPAMLAALAPNVNSGAGDALGDTQAAGQDRLAHAQEVHAAFNEFFGHTFFTQMIKAMRLAERPPAYFHGGRAEEIFRGQLDQTLADEMSRASAAQLAEPMFARQFPQLDAVLREHEAATHDKETDAAGLETLQPLRRR